MSLLLDCTVAYTYQIGILSSSSTSRVAYTWCSRGQVTDGCYMPVTFLLCAYIWYYCALSFVVSHKGTSELAASLRKKRKIISVTSRGDLWGWDNRLSDGGEVVSLTHHPRFTPIPGRYLIPISVRGWVNARGHSAAGRIRQIKKQWNQYCIYGRE
jgi:hypothetical protein